MGEHIDLIWSYRDHQHLTLPNKHSFDNIHTLMDGFYKVIVSALCIDQLNQCLLALPLGLSSKSRGTEWFQLALEAAGVILFYSRGHNLSCNIPTEAVG